jgi:hypothetical protein
MTDDRHQRRGIVFPPNDKGKQEWGRTAKLQECALTLRQQECVRTIALRVAPGLQSGRCPKKRTMVPMTALILVMMTLTHAKQRCH